MTASRSDEDVQVATCRILSTTSRHGPEQTMLVLDGEIDLSALSTLRAALGRCVEQRPASLVVDVAAVGFCDCAGVRELNTAARRTRDCGGRFRLLGADASLRRVCELAGARDVLAACAPPDPADPVGWAAATGSGDPGR